MSARKSPKPRKALKVRLVEIDGHHLTPELYRQYERHLDSRRVTNSNDSLEHIKRLALSDTLSQFRFSMTTEDKVSPIYQELTAIASAVFALGLKYPFYERNARQVRLAGCDTLNRLAAQAHHLGAKIHAIGEAIRHEDHEHVQDWLKRQAALDASSPYGQPPTVE